LGYSRAAPDEHVELSPPLALKLVGPPILLTLAAAYVVGSAAHDADPFGDNFRQSFLYAVLAPSLIVLWLAWAAAFLVLNSAGGYTHCSRCRWRCWHYGVEWCASFSTRQRPSSLIRRAGSTGRAGRSWTGSSDSPIAQGLVE